MGCIARLGCLILLAILCVVGWFTRDLWLPARFRSAPKATATATWQGVSEAGAARARTAILKLSQPTGPVFQNISAGDLASLAMSEAGQGWSRAVDSVAARVDGQRLMLRARVTLSELKGSLGPLASMISNRETVELTGTMFIVKPGVAAFVVSSAKMGRVVLPQAMVPRLLREIDTGQRPAGLPDNALPLPVPAYVGDIRIANGKVTVYKNVK